MPKFSLKVTVALLLLLSSLTLFVYPKSLAVRINSQQKGTSQLIHAHRLRRFRHYLQTGSHVVINEINSVAVTRTGEFIELKHIDPCIFHRTSFNNTGPSLHGYYVVVLHGFSEIYRSPVISFASNLTQYFFKKGRSLFVIGQDNLQPDLPFSSRNVVHYAKVKKRKQKIVGNEQERQKNRISDGDDFPAAVLLLKVFTSESKRRVRRHIWLDSQNPVKIVGRSTERYLKRHVVDMIVYAGAAQTNSCPVFKRISNSFEGHYIVREFDDIFWAKKYQHNQPLDLSLQKCGHYHQIQKPFVFQNFWLSRPTPKTENRCDGMPFVLEKVMPALMSHSTQTSNNGNKNICNGTIPSNLYPKQFSYVALYTWLTRNSMYLSHKAAAWKEYGYIPRVFWDWKATGTCKTTEEVKHQIRRKFQNDSQTRSVLLDLYNNITLYKPAYAVQIGDVIDYFSGKATSCISPIGAGLGGAAIGAYYGAKFGFGAGYAAGKAKSFLGSFLGNLLGSLLSDSLGDLLDKVSDSESKDPPENNVCKTTKTLPSKPPTTSTTTSISTTTTSMVVEKNITEANTTTEEESNQKGSHDERECFFKNKDNLRHREALAQFSTCGETEAGKRLVNLWDIANSETISADYYGCANEADLILARGAALFMNNFDSDESKQFLEANYVCQKHRAEFGPTWDSSVKKALIRIKGQRRGMRCAVPDIGTDPVAMPSHGDTVTLSHYKINREQSGYLVKKMGTFVPVGQPMCSSHYKFVENLLVDKNLDEKNYCLSPRLRTRTFAESPPTGRPFGRHGFATTCGDKDRSYEDETWPVGTLPAGATEKQRNEREQKTALKSFCKAGQISGLHFTDDFVNLAPTTKRKRAQVFKAIFKSVSYLMAKDNPRELELIALQQVAKQVFQAKPSGKVEGILQAVADHFEKARSASEKKQALSVVAPFVTYSEIVQHIPGLSHYYYNQARYYAKLYGAGRTAPRFSNIRIRYDKTKVGSFFSYITSPHVVFDLPFGTVKVTSSTGEVSEIPRLVRTMRNERIAEQYLNFLKQNGQENLAMSRSSLLRILHYCTADHRKSLHGLDYYTFAETEGFDTLIQLIKKIHQSDDWIAATTQLLQESQQYLKGDYKLHIKSHSRVSDHCMSYALSDLHNPSLQSSCEGHRHTNTDAMYCERCEQLKRVLATVRGTILISDYPTEEDKVESIYLMGNATEDIQEWRAHIVRSVHQEQVKNKFLKDMGVNTVFLTLDWAMKWLPTKGRETQTEWFGKRGTSYHITVALVKEQYAGTEQQFLTRSFVHVFDRTRQNSMDVIGIIHNTLNRIKKEKPYITKAILRSDNAGCYHSSQTIGTVHAISASCGIQIINWSFSEAQAGKGPCDRMAANIKRKVHMWVDENHPATNAREFVDGVSSYNGIAGVSLFVGNTEETPKSMLPEKISIPGISSYLDFGFRQPQETKAWRFYGIGPGIMIPSRHWVGNEYIWRFLDTYHAHPNNETGEVQDDHHWKSLTSRHREQVVQTTENEMHEAPHESPENQKLFECPETGCIKKYQYYSNLMHHLEVGVHSYVPERLTLRDYAISMFKGKIEEMTAITERQKLQEAVSAMQNIDEENRNPLPLQGWAIRKAKPYTSFNENQKSYMIEKFLEGENTKKKHDPKKLAQDMRRAKTDTNEPRFTSDEFLKWQQIASFFSRLAAARRAGMCEPGQESQPIPLPDVNGVQDDEYIEESDFETVEKEMENSLLESDCFSNAPIGRKRASAAAAAICPFEKRPKSSDEPEH